MQKFFDFFFFFLTKLNHTANVFCIFFLQLLILLPVLQGKGNKKMQMICYMLVQITALQGHIHRVHATWVNNHELSPRFDNMSISPSVSSESEVQNACWGSREDDRCSLSTHSKSFRCLPTSTLQLTTTESVDLEVTSI